jgi:hypothetical protein
MAPIAISLAQGLWASADPFLMVVAIGPSANLLTEDEQWHKLEQVVETAHKVWSTS